MTRQESTTHDGNNQLVHTVTTSSYDSHNRLSHVVQTDVLTGSTVLDESFSYDAAGNRREVSASSNGTTQQAWYTYDGDNRVVVSDGTLSNGQILITANANSYAQSYDANGDVVNQRTVNAAGDTLLQRNYYDSRDELIRADYAVDLTTGGASRGVEETRTYDADGHALVTQQYYALGTTLGARPLGSNATASTRRTRWYTRGATALPATTRWATESTLARSFFRLQTLYTITCGTKREVSWVIRPVSSRMPMPAGRSAITQLPIKG